LHEVNDIQFIIAIDIQQLENYEFTVLFHSTLLIQHNLLLLLLRSALYLTFTVLLLPHWHQFLQELLIRDRLVEITVVGEPQKEHSTEQFILAVEYFVHVLVQ
jgi:hypothetical protein